MELKYDIATEVTEKQYRKLIVECAGIVAHREENGKFYIKLWIPKYKNMVKRVIETN